VVSRIRFNGDLLSFGVEHLPSATVKVGDISHQIQQRNLLSLRSGSLTLYNGQRGQRQPLNSIKRFAQPRVGESGISASNSIEKSAQIRVGFTYKFNKWICSASGRVHLHTIDESTKGLGESTLLLSGREGSIRSRTVDTKHGRSLGNSEV
jgi:hypothetical protein